MKVSEHFDIRELVSPDMWETFRADSVKFIDDRIIALLERIRELSGGRSITVNNWHRGGKFRYRGYRPESCNTGARNSMHRQGKAVDFDISGMTAEQSRQLIRDNQTELMRLGLRRMERGVPWVHIDLKETGLDYIYEFKP